MVQDSLVLFLGTVDEALLSTRAPVQLPDPVNGVMTARE